MLVAHIKESWEQHLAAAGGTVFAAINGVAILQSVIVGLILFLLTSGLKWAGRKVYASLTRRR
jgi:hypothetical protein